MSESGELPDRESAFVQAFQQWNGGNQAAAVDLIRPFADARDSVGLGLIVWFLHQMPAPAGPAEALNYAEVALDHGNPWVINYVIGAAINDPSQRARLPGLLQKAIRNGSQLDPIAHAQGPFQQGDAVTGIALLEASAGPFPNPKNVEQFVDGIRRNSEQAKAAAEEIASVRAATVDAASEATQAVEGASTRVQTRADQLETLMDQVTNAEAQSLFEQEADRNEREGSNLWRRGLQVLVAAAVVAILPILIFYVSRVVGGHIFEGQNLVAAHFAPALALGAVAGVILARARGRDRAGQRARDLTVALGTMFAYSNQIRDETERQQFLRDMGRTVIESYLTTDSGADTGSSNLLSALASRT